VGGGKNIKENKSKENSEVFGVIKRVYNKT